MKKLGSVPCVAVRSLTHYSEYVILISDPICPSIFPKVLDPVPGHVIHQTKRWVKPESLEVDQI